MSSFGRPEFTFAPPSSANTVTVFTLAKPLAKCGVLYIGSLAPDSDLIGIDSVQDALLKRYHTTNCVVQGIDSVLMVRENGIELSFTQDPLHAIFYPIKSLIYCASVRYIPSRKRPRFVPLDSSLAVRHEGDGHPPLFCVVFRRTRSVPGDECHIFISKTKQSALVLVQACFTAYSRTNKNQNITKVPLYIEAKEEEEWFEIDDEIKVVEAPSQKHCVDFITSTKSGGFFYSTSKAKMDSWQLWDEDKPIGGRYEEKKKKKSRRSSKKQHCSHSEDNGEDRRSFNSSTEYYEIGRHKSTIPRSLNDQYVSAGRSESSSLDTTSMDPYAPAPNLVKVQHVKDPETGANVFIRWFEDTKQDGTPRRIFDSNDLIVEERFVNDRQHKKHKKKLKGILRTRAKSEARKPDHTNGEAEEEEEFEISKAYFEDRLGRKHHFSDRKIEHIRNRNRSLSDECRRKFIEPNNSIISPSVPIPTQLPNGLPAGATVIPQRRI